MTKKEIVLIKVMKSFQVLDLNTVFESDIKVYGKALSAGLPISVIAYKDWLNKEFPKEAHFREII